MTAVKKILGGAAAVGALSALVLGALMVYGSMTMCHLGDRRRPYTHSMLKALGAAIEEFRIAEGYYPEQEGWMEELVSHGYLDQVVSDVWWNPYRSVPGERGFTLMSFGSDGVEGGTDSAEDIVRDFHDKICDYGSDDSLCG